MVPSASTSQDRTRPKLLFGHRSFDWTIKDTRDAFRSSRSHPKPLQRLPHRPSPAEQLIEQAYFLLGLRHLYTARLSPQGFHLGE